MTDTDWLTLADRLDELATDRRWDCWNKHGDGSLDVPEGYDPSPDCCDAADGANALRAAAVGLRQLAAITAERDAAVARAAQLGTGIDSVRSHWHADEGPRWTANVIEAPRHSGLMDDVMLSGMAQHGSVDNHPCGCRWNDLTGRWHLCRYHDGWHLCRYHDGMNDGLAMAASPTPTPDHCPTCDSSEDPERTMGGHWTCYDPWHDSGQP